MSSKVFIATSLDGYIADREGKVDWLNSIPNPDGSDYGFAGFMEGLDALLMGRRTFETVCGFGGVWPYSKPVFVWSSTLQAVPDALQYKVEIVNGSVDSVLDGLHLRGFVRLYVDGGRTIQSFLAEDLIDELIITKIPILLGGGIPLFGVLPGPLQFEHVGTTSFSGGLVQSNYVRKR